MQSYLTYRRFARHPDVQKAVQQERDLTRASPSSNRECSDRSSSSLTRVPSHDHDEVPEEIRAQLTDAEAQRVPNAPREPIKTLEKEKEDPHLVAWTSGDPEDPHNWTYTKRWLLTFFVGHIGLLVGFAASVDAGANTTAAEAYGVSTEIYALNTALFVVGLGLASPMVAPLSEIGGRNPVYIGTMLAFLLLEGGTALSTTLSTRLILRFFSGIAGSTPLSSAGGSLSDIWNPLQRTYVFPVFAKAGFLGPVLGPVIGSFIGQSKLGYRWCNWITAIWGLAAFIPLAFFIPETFSPFLLKMKAHQMRKATRNPNYRTDTERHRMDVPFWDDFLSTMARPFLFAVTDPIVLLFSLYLGLVYMILYGSFQAYTLIFQPYGLNAGQIGLCFLSIGVGLFFVLAFTPRTYWCYKKHWNLCVESYEKEKEIAETKGIGQEPTFEPPQPEERLTLAVWGTLLFPVSLFWFAWTCFPTMSVWPAIVSQSLFGAAMMASYISCYEYIIDAYESYAASALASISLIYYLAATAATMWTQPMFKALGNHWALTLLAFASVAFAPIPWIFRKYGKKIRSWSRYSRQT